MVNIINPCKLSCYLHIVNRNTYTELSQRKSYKGELTMLVSGKQQDCFV